MRTLGARQRSTHRSLVAHVWSSAFTVSYKGDNKKGVPYRHPYIRKANANQTAERTPCCSIDVLSSRPHFMDHMLILPARMNRTFMMRWRPAACARVLAACRAPKLNPHVRLHAATGW